MKLIKLPVLNFEYNNNNKLLCLNFISVLPPTKDYETGKTFKINISDNHFCFAEVIYSKTMYLDEIIKSGYNYLDLGLNNDDYVDHMKKQFGSKKWWKTDQKEISMQVVWFKKVNQLNLFENNDIFVK